METTLTFRIEATTGAGRLRWPRIVLLFVLGYEAVGAILGGVMMIIAPDGRLMQMPTEIMHGTFSDFLIPGIILLGLGILSVFAFVAVARKSSNDWLMAGLSLGGFVIWFVVEIIILRELHWLHAMWGLPVLWGWLALIPIMAERNSTTTMQKGLLVCGILSSLWYVVINIYVPTQYEGYNISTFTVSELSAIGAPTRILWVLLGLLYPMLFAAFGWGVLRAAGQSRHLRIVGGLIIAYCALNFYWPPMHMRGAEFTLTDTMHIAWGIATNIFMWLFMGFGAAALNKRFRIYTVASIALHIVFGVLTVLEAPNIADNEPTPTIGIWERVNIGIFMLWVIVFSLELLRREKSKIDRGVNIRTL